MDVCSVYTRFGPLDAAADAPIGSAVSILVWNDSDGVFFAFSGMMDDSDGGRSGVSLSNGGRSGVRGPQTRPTAQETAPEAALGYIPMICCFIRRQTALELALEGRHVELLVPRGGHVQPSTRRSATPTRLESESSPVYM